MAFRFRQRFTCRPITRKERGYRLIVWAYPLEFNDAKTAGQISGSPSRFTRMRSITHLTLLTQGYAIMDAATMPVIGDPETMNDTFIEQIVDAAQAAIDKAVEMGVADPEPRRRRRAQLRRVHDRQPVGPQRSIQSRCRPQRCLQPHVDSFWIPVRTTTLLGSQGNLLQDFAVHARRQNQ